MRASILDLSLLTLIFITALSIAQDSSMGSQIDSSPFPQPLEADHIVALQVIQGILNGLKMKEGDIDEIIVSIQKLGNQFSKIQQVRQHAMTNLTYIDFVHLSQLLNAVMKISNITREILDKAGLCTEVTPEIIKIHKMLSNVNLREIAENMSIMLLNGDLINKIDEVKSSYKNGQYMREGIAYGELIMELFQKSNKKEELRECLLGGGRRPRYFQSIH